MFLGKRSSDKKQTFKQVGRAYISMIEQQESSPSRTPNSGAKITSFPFIIQQITLFFINKTDIYEHNFILIAGKIPQTTFYVSGKYTVTN